MGDKLHETDQELIHLDQELIPLVRRCQSAFDEKKIKRLS